MQGCNILNICVLHRSTFLKLLYTHTHTHLDQSIPHLRIGYLINRWRYAVYSVTAYKCITTQRLIQSW